MTESEVGERERGGGGGGQERYLNQDSNLGRP